MRFVCISDTHGLHDNINIPDGDVLIHAGDFTNIGEFDDIRRFSSFLGELPHKYKVVIAGNHDISFETKPEEARKLLTNCIYLQDSEVTIEGIRIYGSPWQPVFLDWAFGLPRGQAIRKKWDIIPKGIDILVTHCPPHRILDRGFLGGHYGCEELMKVVKIIKPKYHIYGHLHYESGKKTHGMTTFINASICDEDYNPRRAAVIFDCPED